MRFPWLLPVLAAGLLPRPAFPCAQPPSDARPLLPRDGDTHPANAAVFFHVYDADPGLLDVDVGGRPGRLVPADEIGAGAWWFDPTPAPGETVRIEGRPCEGEACAPVSLTFTAGEPDDTAPSPPPTAWFSIYDHADIEHSGGACGDGGTAAAYAHVPDPPADGGSPVLYRLAIHERGREEALGVAEWSLAVPVGREPADDPPVRVIDLDGPALADIAPEDLCLRVRTQDAAGNVAEFLDICGPCHFRVDPPSERHAGPLDHPDEPSWTEADRIEGGRCDGDPPPPDVREDASPADRESSRRGAGGCHAAPLGPSAPLLWLLAAGVLAHRRRR